ncbi:MAG: Crp/Fnr family transcriptional regulator [Anaerolineae bacterium]|nr:Crp/Fnr family transcriptional regulator [Anaerolineae bacterium]
MNTPSIEEELKGITALSGIAPERLAELAKMMIRRTYAPGEIIFLEGEPATGIWFIARGRVRIIKQSLQGRTQALCLASAGKCFGTCPLFNQETNPANAQAVDEVVLLILPRHAFQHIIQYEPRLVAALLQLYSRHYANLARLSEGLGAWSITTRINDCLLMYAEWDTTPPLIRLTHERLANLAGTVREVVTRHLARLENEGIVHLEPGQIALLKPERLEGVCLAEKE